MDSLEVDPAAVGLKPGAKLNGWAFTQVDGKVFWDQSGGRVDTNPASDPAFSWAAWKSLPENDRNSNLPGALREIVQGKDPAQWPESARRGVFHHWLGHIYAGEIAGLEPLKTERAAIMKEREDITKQTAVTFVMADLPKQRESFVMKRGSTIIPEKVSRGIPAFLPPLPSKPEDRDYNRLDLANWLVDGEHFHCAGRSQVSAAVLRSRTGQDQRGLWHSRRISQSSRIAGLAGDPIR